MNLKANKLLLILRTPTTPLRHKLWQWDALCSHKNPIKIQCAQCPPHSLKIQLLSLSLSLSSLYKMSFSLELNFPIKKLCPIFPISPPPTFSLSLSCHFPPTFSLIKNAHLSLSFSEAFFFIILVFHEG
jgi:hypothetical protein